MIEIVVIILIVAISFDTTLFLQSQISQPIFSCILIGLIVDNIQMGIYIGAISQLIASSYIPVGGSNIPDMQISSNLFLLVFHQELADLNIIGQILPIMIIVSVLFMYVIVVERSISTRYIKQIPYEKIKLPFMLSYSFAVHTLLFSITIVLAYFTLLKFKQVILQTNLYDPIRVLIFIAFFSFGSLAVSYYRRGFKH